MISWHPRFAMPYESPWCVVQKLAWLNACIAPEALSSIARRKVWPSPLSSTGVRNFNDLGWWDEVLSSETSTEEGNELFAAGSAVFGREAVQQFLSFAAPLLADHLRHCVPCVRSGYHSVVHQLAGLARCPIHDAPLHDSCPYCHFPLGPYVLGSHFGFRCVHCDAAFLRNDDLPLPSERGAAAKRNALEPLVTWIGRTLPQLHHPFERELVLGRWKDGAMQAVSLSAALLPLLSQLVPCPLNARYLVDPVPQLAFRAIRSRSEQTVDHAWSLYDQVARTVSTTEQWLRATVLGDHVECYTSGAQFVWGDKDYLGFHPEFCRHGYAFELWCARAYSWLKWVREITDDRQANLIIDTQMLRRQLISSYHFALNGVELLCEMDAQDNKASFDAAWSSGCLEREFDHWTTLHVDQAHTFRLQSCNVAFIARPPMPEPYCDHGEMRAAIWERREQMHKRAEKRSGSVHR